MGRASGQSNISAAKSISKRRGKRSLDASARAFINGTADSASIRVDPRKVALGPEYVLGRTGGGAHGKSGSARHRADRKTAKQSLGRGEY